MKKETENECCCCQRKSNFSWDGVVAFFMNILKWAGFKSPDEVVEVVDEVKCFEKENNNIRKLDDEDLRIGNQYFLRLQRTSQLY